MNLTAPQLRVLRLMRDGFLLPKTWLLFSDEHPGHAIEVEHRTIQELIGWIEPDSFGAYKLTALGRDAAGEGT